MTGQSDLRKRPRKLWMVLTWISALLLALATGSAVEGSFNGGPGTGSITGTAQDGGGSPIVGAVVFVNDYRTGAAAGRAITDSSGNYTVGGLGTGSYRVHVNATRQGFPLQYYDGALDARGATAVSVVDGQSSSSIDFTLSSGGSISGTVTASGTGLAGAEVFVRGSQGGATCDNRV